MTSYAFAIDLRRCIGCHACTIACKAEHAVPLGVNRCWVKTVERGRFPRSERLFFPVLCNQCEAAPCARVCPTEALYRRDDGIVELDGGRCIGCRACMQACPYDQLFIDPETRTAEKCNFCANRIESGLLPACVSVCPTQCRVFGDLEDPASQVASLVNAGATRVRKPEKRTGPKIFYVGAEDDVIVPELAARPFHYKEGQVRWRPAGAPREDPARPGAPRVDYDVAHPRPWHGLVVAYLLAKGVSAGALFLSVTLWALGLRGGLVERAGPALALAFAGVTAALLVLDLERPERFLSVLTRGQPRSWLVRGAFFLSAHAAVAGLWLAAGATGADAVRTWLLPPALLAPVLATVFTSFLFAQGRGRDLWQGRASAFGLLAQAGAAGAAVLLLLAPFCGAAPALRSALCAALLGSLGAHLLLLAGEHLLHASPTRHRALAVASYLRGPFARVFWGGAVVAGGIVPLGLLALAPAASALALAAPVLALAGALAWDYVWVEAGQSVPLS